MIESNTKTPRRKSSYAVKSCISMPESMRTFALAQCQKTGFSAFSDYVQHLIRRDGFAEHSGK